MMSNIKHTDPILSEALSENLKEFFDEYQEALEGKITPLPEQEVTGFFSPEISALTEYRTDLERSTVADLAAAVRGVHDAQVYKEKQALGDGKFVEIEAENYVHAKECVAQIDEALNTVIAFLSEPEQEQMQPSNQVDGDSVEGHQRGHSSGIEHRNAEVKEAKALQNEYREAMHAAFEAAHVPCHIEGPQERGIF